VSAEVLLDRLQGVRESGPGRWMARCPAHEDRSPSLSIRETSDGTVLIHCFGLCSPADILAAVGLELKDLFPEPLDHHKAPVRDRRHLHAAREALKLLAHESLVVLTAAENLAAGLPLDDADRERLLQAAVAIRGVREAAA
jgi:hypothetical protein